MNLAFTVPAGPAEGRLRFAVPAGPLLVSAQIKEREPGARVTIRAAELGNEEKAAGELLESRPDVVAISADDFSLPAGLEIARALFRRSPETPVVLGGPAARSQGPSLVGSSINLVALDGSEDEDVCAAVLLAAARRQPIPAHDAVLTPGPRAAPVLVRGADDRADPDWALAEELPFRSVEMVPFGLAPTWPVRVHGPAGRRSPERVAAEVAALARRPLGRAILLCDAPVEDRDGFLEALFKILASRGRGGPMIAAEIPALASRRAAFFKQAARGGLASLLVRLNGTATADARGLRTALRAARVEGISSLGLLEHDGTPAGVAALEEKLRLACALPIRRTRLVRLPPPAAAKVDARADRALTVARDVLSLRDDAASEGSGFPAVAAAKVPAAHEKSAALGLNRLARRLARMGPPSAVAVAAAAPAPPATPSVLWMGPLFEPGGAAEDARQLVLACSRAGFAVRAVELRAHPWEARLDESVDRELRRLAQTPLTPPTVAVFHGSPLSFRPIPEMARMVGRTHFETDRLPESWVGPCCQLDAIWVPSTFHVESFARAGVPIEKLLVLPPALDAESAARSSEALPELASPRKKIGSILEWNASSGWDLLLEAFCREFRPDEPVELVLQVYSRAGKLPGDIRREAEELLRQKLRRSLASFAPVRFRSQLHSPEEIRRLYASLDVFALPSRGAGSTRAILEAMAAGLPVVATRWGGHLDFAHERNAWLVDSSTEPVPDRALRELPLCRGHRWAEPSLDSLRSLLRRSVEDRESSSARGALARTEVMARFSSQKASERLRAVVSGSADAAAFSGAERARAVRRAPAARSSVRVVWEGPFPARTPAASAHRELGTRLAQSAGLEVSFRSTDDAPAAGPADVHVSLAPPRRLDPPAEGRWVWIVPSTAPSIPADWARTCRRFADEVWCPTRALRDAAIAAGVPADRVALVPPGVDSETFRPGERPRSLPVRGRFRFLFAGGAGEGGGLDLALAAYAAQFTDRDDVALLVVPEAGAASDFEAARLAVQSLRARPAAPEVHALSAPANDAERVALYAACDALVSPHRVDAFPQAALEAMACGVPAVIADGAAAAELCDASCSYPVPCVSSPRGRIEPDAAALGRKLREAFGDASGRRARAEAARARVLRTFAWERVREAAASRLAEISRRPVRRSDRGARSDSRALALRLDGGEVKSDRAARSIALGAAAQPARAVAASLLGASEPWVAVFSDGAPDVEGLLDDLLVRAEADRCDALLARGDGGAILVARREKLERCTADAQFRTGAALVELARALEAEGARVARCPLEHPSSPADRSAFDDECRAIDAVARAATALAAGDVETALAESTAALASRPQYEAAIRLASTVAEALSKRSPGKATRPR